jgi:hypothetical protein
MMPPDPEAQPLPWTLYITINASAGPPVRETVADVEVLGASVQELPTQAECESAKLASWGLLLPLHVTAMLPFGVTVIWL